MAFEWDKPSTWFTSSKNKIFDALFSAFRLGILNVWTFGVGLIIAAFWTAASWALELIEPYFVLIISWLPSPTDPVFAVPIQVVGYTDQFIAWDQIGIVCGLLMTFHISVIVFHTVIYGIRAIRGIFP